MLKSQSSNVFWAGPTVAVWRTTQTLIIGCNVSSGGSKKCKPETGVEILKSAGGSAGAPRTRTVPSRVTGKPRGFKSFRYSGSTAAGYLDRLHPGRYSYFSAG